MIGLFQHSPRGVTGRTCRRCGRVRLGEDAGAVRRSLPFFANTGKQAVRSRGVNIFPN